MMVLHNKLLNTAKELRTWSQSLFSDARMQLHMAEEIILRLDEAQDTRALSTEEMQLRSQLKTRVLGLAAIERSRRRQSSRITWLKEGDATTKLFHAYANRRRRKKLIPHLRREDDTIAWSHAEKEQEIKEYYRRIMRSKTLRTRSFNWAELNLSKIDAPELDAPFI